jgi:Prenyltransferase and squalene oxidase repeat
MRNVRPRCKSWIVVPIAVCSALLAGPFESSLPAAPPTAQQKRVDDAVVRALKSLARDQEPSGAWRIRSYGESTASTSLAVMAFMAAGHVPGEGPYGKRLERAIDWVLDHQQPIDTTRGKETVMLVARRSHGPMYSHGISTLMLCEVAGMLKKDRAKRCRETLEKAVRLIVKSQNVPKHDQHAGGWRYQASSRDSDLSVTGWQLLALRAARNIGCDVPKHNIDRAVEYVKRCQSRFGSGFGYQPGGGPTSTRTGTGILCLEVCGKHKSPEVMAGADYLLQRPLHSREPYFFYGVYYCTVGMFKVGGKYWSATRDHITRVLLASQRSDGSWYGWGGERRYGETYCTAMAVLALAVEYRYLPIYQR